MTRLKLGKHGGGKTKGGLVNSGPVKDRLVKDRLVNGGLINGGLINGGLVNDRLVNGGLVNVDQINGKQSNDAALDDSQLRKKFRWAIFCKVIDNFGDAGVCWRLAQQLAGQYGFKVDLFIDQVNIIGPFGRYTGYEAYDASELQVQPWPNAGDADPVTNKALHPLSLTPSQTQTQLSTAHFQSKLPADYDVIVAAFASVLPASWLDLMAGRRERSWFNLEYLSAEPWVAQCHLLNSIKPISGACETFFFPGFETGTGGLLREPWIKTRELAPVVTENAKNVNNLTISIFCYENAPVQQLLDQLEGRTVTIKLASSGWTFSPVLSVNTTLTVENLPFLSQDEYDQLLARCDLNFVRGEDSLVRAIWAAKPFVWQLYEQDENAHIVKLEAFLATYCAPSNNELKTLITSIFCWWNQIEVADQKLTAELSAFSINNAVHQLPAWALHAAKLCDALGQKQDLCSALVDSSGIIEGFANRIND